ALLAKNSAHWLMADWAIWMAGHVTVPLYPTLSADTVRYILGHSESKLLFVGKLDDWKTMKSACRPRCRASGFRCRRTPKVKPGTRSCSAHRGCRASPTDCWMTSPRLFTPPAAPDSPRV